jgi:hypothetical protein
MLTKIASHLATSKKLRHLFFLGSALIAIYITGYHFGTWDQAIYLPFLRAEANPALYPGDPFINLRFYHYTFFWQIFVPFLRWGLLEPAMFVVYILATYATFWMVWKLSDTLFKNPLTNLLCVAAYIFPHVTMPGILIIETSLLNRSVVFPFLLAAIILYLRRRHWQAFLLLGLMYNLHVISANFIMAMLIFDMLRRFRQVGLRTFVTGIILFLIGALPVLIWRGNATILDLSLRPDITTMGGRGMLPLIYDFFTVQPYFIFANLGGLASLILFHIAVKENPSPSFDPLFKNFYIAILLVIGVAIITSYWLPITFILQFQIIRIAFFLTVLAIFYFSNYLVNQYQSGKLSLPDFGLHVLAFATFFSPLLPFTVWAVRRWFSADRKRQMIILSTIGVTQFIIILAAVAIGLWSPGYSLYAANTPWIEVQEWAKYNTPITARFITPPGQFSAEDPDWRVFSERATVVTLPEQMEISFAPNYLQDWLLRVNRLAPGAVAQFNGEYFHNLKTANEAFYQLPPSEIIRIAQDYQASYLVVENKYPYPFSEVYQNKKFVVYDLRSLVQEP